MINGKNINTQTKTKAQTHTGVVAVAALALFGLALYGYGFGFGTFNGGDACAGENEPMTQEKPNCCQGLQQDSAGRGICVPITPPACVQAGQVSNGANCCQGLVAKNGFCVNPVCGGAASSTMLFDGCCAGLNPEADTLCKFSGCAQAGNFKDAYVTGCCAGTVEANNGRCVIRACGQVNQPERNYIAGCCSGLIPLGKQEWGNPLCKIPGCAPDGTLIPINTPSDYYSLNPYHDLCCNAFDFASKKCVKK